MKKLVLPTLLAFLTICSLATAIADTLVMRDGSRVTGTFQSVTATTIAFKLTNGTVHRYAKTKVQAIEFGTAAQTATTAKKSAKLETLPAGTELAVITNELIDSQTAPQNKSYSAQLEQDVLGPSNEVLIPKASPAELVIRSVSSGGITGSPEMALDIQSITVQGQRYTVSTTDLAEKSNTGIGMNKRTAEMIGGGTAVGTIIGAVAGQGKGALIGGVAGAAAGTGTQVLLKGKEVKVPAETTLHFKLDQPVTLQLTN